MRSSRRVRSVAQTSACAGAMPNTASPIVGMGDGDHGEIVVGEGGAAERGQRRHQLDDRRHRRDAGLGHGGMRGLALQHDAHAARGAVDHAGLEPDLAERHAGQIVQREGEIRRDLAEARIGDDAGRAIAGLFRRLEHQHDAAARRPLAAELAAKGGQDRGVPVMAAHMRLARHLRGMRHA